MFTLIPLVGIAVGIGLLAWAVHSWRKGEATLHWPSVQGEITGVQVEERRDSEGDVSYRACVAYRYAVSGRTFDGTRLAAGGSLTSNSHDAALSKVSRYRPGMKVKVFHDPADPAYGVLEVGAQYTIVAFLVIMALVFIGISAVLLKGAR